MKLSEAMREGAKLRPQAFGGLFISYDDGIRSCAVGAGFEGETGSTKPTNGAFKAWAVSHGLVEDRLDSSLVLNDFYWSIAYKNDRDRMTREQIADWLESEGY